MDNLLSGADELLVDSIFRVALAQASGAGEESVKPGAQNVSELLLLVRFTMFELNGLGAERARQRFNLLEGELFENPAPIVGVAAFERELLIEPKIPLLIENAFKLFAVVFMILCVDVCFQWV